MTRSRDLLIAKVKKCIVQELKRRAQRQEQYQWEHHARPSQRIPVDPFRIWLILAGRGFGKTRTGAETIRHWATQGQYRRIALIADTESDAREVMIEGNSGLLAVHPDQERPQYEPSKRRLTWPNGATATIYSAENYEKLRGPQFDCAWVDELAKFRNVDKLWEQLQFSLRLGNQPKILITTTPRPIPLLQTLVAQEGRDVVITRGSTFENSAHLSADFISSIQEKYQGTRLGNQELQGEMLTTVEGALWTHALLAQHRIEEVPALVRIVVAIDPAVTHHEKSDETGIVVAGISAEGKGYVLEDLSGKYSTTAWAQVAVEAFHRWQADRLVAEVNQGGDLVEKIIRSIDPHVSYKSLYASRGKLARAEPVAALYEQGKVFHVRRGLEKLEHQMCSYAVNLGQKSPDRLDALVWALSELMFNTQKPSCPRIWKV